MTDTPTADVEATYAQTMELIEAGSELVRWTVNDHEAAKGAVLVIKRLRAHGHKNPYHWRFSF
jgi:(E)-4-hydroxy-3-methylbut-2-enyl-diphosphate synthase